MSFVEEVADNIVFLLEGNIEFKGTLNDIKDKYQGHTLEQAIANILMKGGGSTEIEGDRLVRSEAEDNALNSEND